MEFQEQKFAEARVVIGAVSSARIRTSIKGLEYSEDQGHDLDQDQGQGAFCSGKAIIDLRVGSHHWVNKKK